MAENKQDLGTTDLGMQPNVAALLCYLLGVITGVIFYVIEKKNKFVRFHAMQSIITFGGIFVAMIVLGFLPFVGWMLGMLLWLFGVILWVILMVKGYQGEWFKLPVIGDIAEKNS
ncbi:MAG: DUF4870 domain-containing protein [Candidatus Omnitrophica bacterium]|nr:DUF4870 domain-containing protein [Candidatus Omnitrophota bacterium]MDD5236760.1 DUF4870 domain-containing protein [Candidatus Omnitrophota bacterium]MDD5610063.1 DUF4870 domain-containing protein [Candidatus Omnitrophota bacterium]